MADPAVSESDQAGANTLRPHIMLRRPRLEPNPQLRYQARTWLIQSQAGRVRIRRSGSPTCCGPVQELVPVLGQSRTTQEYTSRRMLKLELPSGGMQPARTPRTEVMPHMVLWALSNVPRLGWILNEPSRGGRIRRNQEIAVLEIRVCTGSY